MLAKRAWLLGPLFFAVLAAKFVVFSEAQVSAPPQFARQIHELSEPGGNFDTDNLISNERSYLHVIPALKQAALPGGAYIGVGPDQNFSYIAATRPSVAFIIDVRRDNLLLHLLFKALFELADSRAQYLELLLGRHLPPPPDQWRNATLEKIVARLDAVEPREDDVQALRKQVQSQIATFGVPLTPQDISTIDRFHRTFIDAGLSLKFQSFGRAPRAYYPTYRELLFETDRQGRRQNFLVSEADFQFVRRLEEHDLIIPVVGNLAGPTALAAIGRTIKQRGEPVSVFYVSNVELYLFQDGVFPRYADTLATMPHTNHSVIVRSIFTGPGVASFWTLLNMKPGYASASATQPIDEFARDWVGRKYQAYGDLVSSSIH